MERSVQLIVAGGLVGLAGLWTVAAGGRIGQWHLAGVPIALAGVLALALGIARDLTVGAVGD